MVLSEEEKTILAGALDVIRSWMKEKCPESIGIFEDIVERSESGDESATMLLGFILYGYCAGYGKGMSVCVSSNSASLN